MNQDSKGKLSEKPRILVAPLDWGLGHTTRCVPIIKELLDQGCDVLLAGNDKQAVLLNKEFPELQLIHLDGYNIRYSRKAWSLPFRILFQVPLLLKKIKQENEWLNKIINEYKINAIISDNRYGMYHPSIPCVFLTHQLRIKTNAGKWIENFIQKKNYDYINRFEECWIPDNEHNNSLAGKLSHPLKNPSADTHYIGVLTRMQKIDIPVVKNHLLIIISGPEPQRTIFENIIIKQITHYPGTATIVRGLPENNNLIPSTNTIAFYNHLPSHELNEEMCKADLVIGRSGYSTIMDLAKLGKKSILIPTPGQTEQEYLAKYLYKKRMAIYFSQKKFDLLNAIETAYHLNYSFPEIKQEKTISQVIKKFLLKIS